MTLALTTVCVWLTGAVLASAFYRLFVRDLPDEDE